jgi:coenzyme F420-reducing hydrogenase delta subunit
LEEGAQEVHIDWCEHDNCLFRTSEEWIRKHVNNARKLLTDIGMDPEKIKLMSGEKK